MHVASFKLVRPKTNISFFCTSGLCERKGGRECIGMCCNASATNRDAKFISELRGQRERGSLHEAAKFGCLELRLVAQQEGEINEN